MQSVLSLRRDEIYTNSTNSKASDDAKFDLSSTRDAELDSTSDSVHEPPIPETTSPDLDGESFANPKTLLLYSHRGNGQIKESLSDQPNHPSQQNDPSTQIEAVLNWQFAELEKRLRSVLASDRCRYDNVGVAAFVLPSSFALS